MNPFDKYAKEYDKWFDENKIIYESEIEAIKKHILKGEGLEIGVGTGRFAVPFNIKIGVDISKEKMENPDEVANKIVSALRTSDEKALLKQGKFDLNTMEKSQIASLLQGILGDADKASEYAEKIANKRKSKEK
jgi:ubiquinone/menaquinone biosynthesis C-methylase UbiE